MQEIEKYDFGLRLQSLRKRKSLSQTALAKKLGVTKSTIYRYERNTLLPPLDKAIMLAQILDTSLDFLVGLDKIPSVEVDGLTEDEIAWLNYTIRVILKQKKHK